MDDAAVHTDESYDSFDEQRPAERWAPLGAAAISPEPTIHEMSHKSQSEQLRELEEEQDELNSSLLALTTHFAQVQFRLKQIVSADPDHKEDLLKELEEFAFKGIPDVRGCRSQDAQILEEVSEREHEMKISEQREKQRELIQQLKSQLEDLELYAYETGDAELPTNKIMEKQKVLIDELRHKLDLNLENFGQLSTEDLKHVVDHAISQIINPAKVKEKLVNQLQTQIVDLERFIQFLQGETTSPGPLGKERCTCVLHGVSGDEVSDNPHECCAPPNHRPGITPSARKAQKRNHETALNVVKKALAVLQIFAISQLGCGTNEFKRNLMKRTPKGNHWGDLRAKLEMAISKVIQAARDQDQAPYSTENDSDSDEVFDLPCSSPALTQAVRRDLAMAIKELMQHGLMEIGQSTSIIPLGCFPSRSSGVAKMMHAWDLLLKYYDMKHGREYNDSPARKLSQSFHLEIVGGKAITAKQTLLGAVDTVNKIHASLRRTEDSHFKAFICLALNENKLSTWLRLLYRTQSLIDYYYQDWSYVSRTGFDDTVKSLDKLNGIVFHLPVDLAMQQFKNIKDAF